MFRSFLYEQLLVEIAGSNGLDVCVCRPVLMNENMWNTLIILVHFSLQAKISDSILMAAKKLVVKGEEEGRKNQNFYSNYMARIRKFLKFRLRHASDCDYKKHHSIDNKFSCFVPLIVIISNERTCSANMSTIILFAIPLVIGALVVFECWRQYLNRTKLKNFVVLSGLPVLGNVLNLFMSDSAKLYSFPKRILAKYKLRAELAFVWMGPVLMMCTNEPNAIECILNSDKALKKSYVYNFLRNTNGIFTSFPHVWKVHRRALNPTLGPKMIDTFYPVFNEKSKIMVDLMAEQIGDNIDMHRIAFKATLDSIFSTSFGLEWPMQNRTGDKLRYYIMELFHCAQTRIQNWWLQPSLFHSFSKLKQEEDEVYPPFQQLVQAAFVAKSIDLDNKLTHGDDELARAKETHSLNYIQKCFQMKLENKFTDEDIMEEMQTILVKIVTLHVH